MLANKEQITAAADLIAHHMQPTAQLLLAAFIGALRHRSVGKA